MAYDGCGQQIAQVLRRAGLHEQAHRVAERLQLSLLSVGGDS
ncbi:hypothetical protein ABZT04_39660 [Streptomyces sp. NPDC005492]